MSPAMSAKAKYKRLMFVQQGLPFGKVQHEVASLDAQPSNQEGGILVLVSGRLLV